MDISPETFHVSFEWSMQSLQSIFISHIIPFIILNMWKVLQSKIYMYETFPRCHGNNVLNHWFETFDHKIVTHGICSRHRKPYKINYNVFNISMHLLDKKAKCLVTQMFNCAHTPLYSWWKKYLRHRQFLYIVLPGRAYSSNSPSHGQQQKEPIFMLFPINTKVVAIKQQNEPIEEINI